MTKYVGYRKHQILFISDVFFEADSGIKLLKVENDIDDKDSKLVMSNYYVVDNKIMPKGVELIMDEQRLAIIAPFDLKCGISIYMDKLFPFLKGPYQATKLFTEWDYGERGGDLSQLLGDLEQFDPHVIYVEHQYGLFPNQKEWLRLTEFFSTKKTFVKMHCVYKQPMQLLDGTENFSYLNTLQNIIVHTEQAKTELIKLWGLLDTKVSVIAHGCDAYSEAKLEPLAPRLFSFGFGLKYKGHETIINMTEELVKEFPDLLSLNFFSDQKRYSEVYDTYFEELEQKKNKHTLFYKKFVWEDTLVMLAQDCSLAIFPYVDSGEREVYGTSGAARLTLSAGIPLVTSCIPLFDDLEGIVFKGKDQDEMVGHIRTILRDPSLRAQILSKQKSFVEANSWSKVAEQHLKLFGGNL